MHGSFRLSHRTRRLGARWLALAVLLASLQPVLAQAWRHWGGGGGDWVQVCTSVGMRWVTLQGSGAGAADAAQAMPGHGDPSLPTGPDHCPWCRSGLHLPSLPAADRLILPVAMRIATPPPSAPPSLGRVPMPPRHERALVRAPPPTLA